ncbi:MAG TPA: PAS domain S-box protein, partial [Gammaproteobacteria bacterium]|nr:PAS domain S-box protein [Gammaproteobacteria bacterium]
AFLVIEARATYLLFNLLELKKTANFEAISTREASFLSTFQADIERSVAEMASFTIAGHGRALAQAKAALEQAHAALVNLRKIAGHEHSTDENGIGWRNPFPDYHHKLLALAENEYVKVRWLLSRRDPDAVVMMLKDLNHDERLLDKLRAGLWRQSQSQYIASNRDIRHLAQLAIQTRIWNSVILLTVVCAAVFFTRQYIIKPIRHLATAAAGVAEGDFEQTVDVTAKGEIGDLQAAFNRMVQDLQAQCDTRTVRDYAIFMLDAQGRVRSWNAGAERIKGYTANEIIGRHFSCFYTPEARAADHPRHVLEVATREGRYEEEGWRMRKDGTQFLANVIITAVYDTQGRLRGFTKVTYDVTERRATETALRESEERLRLLVEGVRDYAIFMLDAQGRVQSWNAGAERITGYTADETIGKPFFSFHTSEIQTNGHTTRELEIAKRQGRYEEEGWRIRKDGSRFIAHMLVTALRDAEGHLRGFANITRDITERKESEALRNSEAQLRLIIDSALDAVVVINEQGVITNWNPQAEAVFGWSCDEAINAVLADLVIPQEYREAHCQGLAHFLASGEGPLLNKRLELVALHKEGRTFPIELTIAPMRLSDHYEFSAFIRDITDRKIAVKRLLEQEKRLNQ